MDFMESTQVMKLETFLRNPNRARRAWFSATAKSPNGVDWSVEVVADFVPTETFMLVRDPLELMNQKFNAYRNALQSGWLGRIG